MSRQILIWAKLVDAGVDFFDGRSSHRYARRIIGRSPALRVRVNLLRSYYGV